jgi:tryptophanyl-tRNA synthetase
MRNETVEVDFVPAGEMPERVPTRVMSGSRPTGRLHLGHLIGVLENWARLGQQYEAFFEVADLHALTTDFEDPQLIRDSRDEMVRDWLAAGIDPERSVVFLQSAVPQISELNGLLAMITPISWLQRVPTFKEQIEALGAEIATYGFLGYPLLQLCDIAVFRADTVPVGRDQLSHLEFGREVVRRFNFLYGPTLVEPQALLSQFPAVPGSDGRKMSKSYHNTIDIADDEAATTKKVRSYITDPQKIRRNDPGRPEICPVFALHHYSNAGRVEEIREACAAGALGCVDCKSELAETLNAYLRPVRARRATFDTDRIEAILAAGSARARVAAQTTMIDVRRAMRLTDG